MKLATTSPLQSPTLAFGIHHPPDESIRLIFSTTAVGFGGASRRFAPALAPLRLRWRLTPPAALLGWGTAQRRKRTSRGSRGLVKAAEEMRNSFLFLASLFSGSLSLPLTLDRLLLSLVFDNVGGGMGLQKGVRIAWEGLGRKRQRRKWAVNVGKIFGLFLKIALVFAAVVLLASNVKLL